MAARKRCGEGRHAHLFRWSHRPATSQQHACEGAASEVINPCVLGFVASAGSAQDGLSPCEPLSLGGGEGDGFRSAQPIRAIGPIAITAGVPFYLSQGS